MSFEVDLVDKHDLADHCRELFAPESQALRNLATHCAALCVREREAREDQEPLQRWWARWWAELGVPEKERKIGRAHGRDQPQFDGPRNTQMAAFAALEMWQLQLLPQRSVLRPPKFQVRKKVWHRSRSQL